MERIQIESDSRDHKNDRVAGESSRSIELFRDASKYTYESELQGSLDNALQKNTLKGLWKEGLVLLSIGISWENNLKGSLSNEKKQHQRSSLGRIMGKGERGGWTNFLTIALEIRLL